MNRMFPEQYSARLRTLLKAVSIGEPNIVGSAVDPRLMYSADVDCIQELPVSAGNVRKFQRMVVRADKVGTITDLKIGEFPEWNLLTKVRVGKRGVRNYKQGKELAHLKELYDASVVSHDEFMFGMKLLKPKLTLEEFFVAQKALRFGVFRWNKKEVLQGEKVLRDGTRLSLADAFKSKGITKIDLVAWDGLKYIELSNILLWRKRKGDYYAKMGPSIQDNILQFQLEGNYMKVAKRMFALAKSKGRVQIVQSLLSILNSQLGKLYVVLSDLKLLEEFPEATTTARRRKQLDLMRNAVAKLYYPELERATPSLKLIPLLEEVLQREVKSALEDVGLLPIPSTYLPAE